MTTKRKSYKGLIIVLTFILMALFIYVNRDSSDDDQESNERELHNKKLIDSLGRVNDQLLQLIEVQRKKEEEAYTRFKQETEKMKKEYDQKIRNLGSLNTDEHVEFLSNELSKED